MNQLSLLLLVVGLALCAGVAFRRRRRHPQPCPWWLRRPLENRYMEAVAGAPVLIERMDLKPGMWVLDVGCGPGRLTIPLARFVGPTGRVMGFDIQERMLQVLGERIKQHGLPNVEVVRGRAGEGDIKWENVFDRAILTTVLGEIPRKEIALREIFRALKPGGILSVTEVLPDPDYQPVRKVERLATAVGFEAESRNERLLAFTLNFRKPGRSAERA